MDGRNSGTNQLDPRSRSVTKGLRSRSLNANVYKVVCLGGG